MMAIMSGAYHLGNAAPHLMVLLTARVAAATVYKTITRIPKIDPYSTEGRKLYDLQGKIGFKNVSFRYPSRPETKVLKDFSFECNAGQTIALVGQSGSGKSTIVGILNRLYEFESGHVTIDGVDIREMNVKWLRTIIGTVQQEPIIFNDTVENNIKQGCDSLTEKEMVEAYADRIIVMHKGRFVESGTHHELLERKGGVYAKLVAAQELHNMNIDKKDGEEEVDGDLLSPDQPNAALTIASKTVRESIRESFMRDFLPSDHLGDAQTEAYDIELEKIGAKKASLGQIFVDARELWPILFIALGICC
uniref:ABC transporter domain-containing protein n=1 Tax=Panagrolaimus sp. ES5 TaxID=591445 RepID=A0AC34GAJ8_9BILA